MCNKCNKKQAPYFATIRIVFTIITMCFFTCVAYAYEDVPPAVPVNSVKVEALSLPEPGKALSQKTQKEKQETTAKSSTFLGRLWSGIVGGPAEQNDKEIQKLSETSKHRQVPKKQKPKIRALKEPLMKPLRSVMPENGVFSVLELFTTQACPFCPKADAAMEVYANKPDVIALSCHVDYFDVHKGSLSQPICSSRQMRYESSFKGTPKYTPQMVVNGRYNAVGYLPDKITQAFNYAREHPVLPLKAKFKAPSYNITLPDYNKGRYHLWIVTYDRPHLLKIKDGANAGRDIVYYNVVSKAKFLGSWDGRSRNFEFEVDILRQVKGFTVFVQDAQTGSILMASKNEI